MLPSQRIGIDLRGIYHALSNAAPKTTREELRKKMIYAGLKTDAEEWLGSTLFLGLLMFMNASLGTWVLLRIEDPVIVLGAGLVFFLVIIISTYTLLFMQIEDRKNRVERVLPDALQMVAANMRAGMTPISALRTAAKPELGPLEEEIKYATAKSLGTGSFVDAIGGMSDRLQSDILLRSVALFKASLRAGGHLAELLESTAEDIRNTQELKRELVSSTQMYVLFILFTIVIGTPLLLAVSLQFVTMVTGLQKTTGGGGSTGEVGALISLRSPLSIDFLKSAALGIIITTSILASMLIGVIREGKELSGIKYSPLIIIGAYIVFHVMREYVLKAILPVTG